MCDAYKRLSLLFIMVLANATTLLVCFIPSQFKIQLSNTMYKKRQEKNNWRETHQPSNYLKCNRLNMNIYSVQAFLHSKFFPFDNNLVRGRRLDPTPMVLLFYSERLHIIHNEHNQFIELYFNWLYRPNALCYATWLNCIASIVTVLAVAWQTKHSRHCKASCVP